MTATEYGIKVTGLIDAATGGGFVYPDTFEADLDVCLLKRLSPDEAAEGLLAAYSAD